MTQFIFDHSVKNQKDSREAVTLADADVAVETSQLTISEDGFEFLRTPRN